MVELMDDGQSFRVQYDILRGLDLEMVDDAIKKRITFGMSRRDMRKSDVGLIVTEAYQQMLQCLRNLRLEAGL